ncbi:MAG TPA: hypothetical protein VEV83_17590 [Parafilimonas sp.]|nr:hypothetical protein [Parafilimonas sp.]
MRTITKLGSVLAFIAIMASSCSVEYRTRHRRHRVIEVGMNVKDTQHTQVANAAGQGTNGETPVAVK